ncbi:hypothetical protein N431DRAFT_563897 [Stipitochalara longipes BDJ]|nr:hypothetical protein N431DRAFT_563897 [Stipitochalara longipes BDJ]
MPEPKSKMLRALIVTALVFAPQPPLNSFVQPYRSSPGIGTPKRRSNEEQHLSSNSGQFSTLAEFRTETNFRRKEAVDQYHGSPVPYALGFAEVMDEDTGHCSPTIAIKDSNVAMWALMIEAKKSAWIKKLEIFRKNVIALCDHVGSDVDKLATIQEIIWNLRKYSSEGKLMMSPLYKEYARMVEKLASYNVTESHLMGFTVLAPPSTLADDIIPAFNAAKAQAEIVSEPNFPALEEANKAFLPAAPTGDPAAQWPAVKNAWESPTMGAGAGAGQEFVDVWAGLMGWVMDGIEPLVGKAPKLTLGACDQTDMAAPLLQV